MLLRSLATLISYLLHPLLLLTYFLALLMWVNPYLFGDTVFQLDRPSTAFLLRIFFSTCFLPLFAIVLMKFLGLITSLNMEDSQERIGPFIATSVFYLWIFVNIRLNPEIPVVYKIFVLGATIALLLSFFINLFRKVNVHAVSMGILVAGIFLLNILYSFSTVNMMVVLMAAIVIAGLVGTAQLLLLRTAEPTDIYGGYLIGGLALFVAAQFML